MERVSLLAAASLLSTLAAPRSVTAATPGTATPARLEVEALPACSTRDELVARVVARSTRIRFVNDAPGVPVLTARIDVGPKGVVIAELLVVEPDGRKFQRRIEAPSCAAATDALALVIAITLDPSANLGDVSSGGAAADARAAPVEEAKQREPAAAAEAPPPQPAVEAAREEPPAPDTFTFTFGAGAAAVAGPAPQAMPGPAVELLAAFDRAAFLSPALALSFAHVWSDALMEAGGTARFVLDLFSLDACPLRLTASRVEARACAAASLGRLSAEGSNTYDPRSVARAFATAGGTARLAIRLPWRLVVQARVGAAAALWRDAFQFTPDVFHRVASVTLVGDVGLGVRFP